MAVRTVVVTLVTWGVNQLVLDAVVHALEHAQGRVIHVHTVAAHAVVHVVTHARIIAVVAVLAEGLVQAIVLAVAILVIIHAQALAQGSVLLAMDALTAEAVILLVQQGAIQRAMLVVTPLLRG